MRWASLIWSGPTIPRLTRMSVNSRLLGHGVKAPPNVITSVGVDEAKQPWRNDGVEVSELGSDLR